MNQNIVLYLSMLSPGCEHLQRSGFRVFCCLQHAVPGHCCAEVSLEPQQSQGLQMPFSEA